MSLGLGLVPSQQHGGPSLHGVLYKRCNEIFVGEQPDGYDKVIHSSYLGEVYATHSGVCELKVILNAFPQLSVCVLL